jgi:hypothetical protein
MDSCEHLILGLNCKKFCVNFLNPNQISPSLSLQMDKGKWEQVRKEREKEERKQKNEKRKKDKKQTNVANSACAILFVKIVPTLAFLNNQNNIKKINRFCFLVFIYLERN